MESGRGQSPGRDSSLRRVAIVLHSLPESVAIRLLGDVPPDTRRRLRETIRALGEVEPWERQLALQSFRGSIQQHPTRPGDSGHDQPGRAGVGLGEDEATFSNASHGSAQNSPAQNSPAQNSPAPTTFRRDRPSQASRAGGHLPRDDERLREADPPRSRLAFLRDVSDASMVELLCGEHPQTIALVLATIDPDQAARVLPKLHPVQRQEAISRIGRLAEIPGEAVTEIAEHLRSRVAGGIDQKPSLDARAGSDAEPATEGQRALTAIFAKLPRPLDHDHNRANATPPPRPETVDDSALAQISRLRELRDQLDASTPTGSTQAGSTQAGSTQAGSTRAGSTRAGSTQARSTQAGTHTERSAGDGAAPGVRPGHDPADRHVASPANPSRPIRPESHDANPAPAGSQTANPVPRLGLGPAASLSTDEIHRHLVGLAPEQLCRALGKVDTRQALLTLCGLPADVAEAVLAVLPRGHGKTVRRQLAALGSLRIRDIDEAKEAVAHASRTTATESESATGARADRERNEHANEPPPLQPVAA